MQFFICAFLQCSFDLTKRRVCCEGFVLKAAQLHCVAAEQYCCHFFVFLKWFRMSPPLGKLIKVNDSVATLLWYDVFKDISWKCTLAWAGFLSKGGIILQAWLSLAHVSCNNVDIFKIFGQVTSEKYAPRYKFTSRSFLQYWVSCFFYK